MGKLLVLINQLFCGCLIDTKQMSNTIFTRGSAWGAHLILGSQRRGWGADSREALIKYIKKTSKYFQLVALVK